MCLKIMINSDGINIKGGNFMGEVIVITSGKGGVGKTTTTANLGSALALAGKKVALVDTDIGLRNLDVVLGLENRIVYDLVDVIEEKCKLRQAFIFPSITSGFFANLCLNEPIISSKKASSDIMPLTFTTAASIGVFGKYFPSVSIETFLASIL